MEVTRRRRLDPAERRLFVAVFLIIFSYPLYLACYTVTMPVQAFLQDFLPLRTLLSPFGAIALVGMLVLALPPAYLDAAWFDGRHFEGEIGLVPRGTTGWGFFLFFYVVLSTSLALVAVLRARHQITKASDGRHL